MQLKGGYCRLRVVQGLMSVGQDQRAPARVGYSMGKVSIIRGPVYKQWTRIRVRIKVNCMRNGFYDCA